MEMKKLYHGTNWIETLNNIHSNGVFGSGLFFAVDRETAESHGDAVVSIEIDEEKIIPAFSFFYREDYDKLEAIVAEIAKKAGVDTDTAEDLLSGHESLSKIQEKFDGELDWEIQKMSLDAAKILGFDAVELEDEHGTVYLVEMMGRENELAVENL